MSLEGLPSVYNTLGRRKALWHSGLGSNLGNRVLARDEVLEFGEPIADAIVYAFQQGSSVVSAAVQEPTQGGLGDWPLEYVRCTR